MITMVYKNVIKAEKLNWVLDYLIFSFSVSIFSSVALSYHIFPTWQVSVYTELRLFTRQTLHKKIYFFSLKQCFDIFKR